MSLFHKTLIALSIPTSFFMSLFLFAFLVPDPDIYHQGKYLTDTPLPWWIRTFFPPVDAMLHPEPGIFYFTLCIAAGMGITYGLLQLSEKLD